MASHGLKTLFYIFKEFKGTFCDFENITSNCQKGTFFAILRTSLPTAKKVPFSQFWEHHFQLPKRYLFALLRTSLPTAEKVPFCAFHEIAWNRKKKVPLLRFKTSFGKVKNEWRADNIDVKISFNRKLKIPDFFFKKRYLFLIFNLNDKHRQKR